MKSPEPPRRPQTSRRALRLAAPATMHYCLLVQAFDLKPPPLVPDSGVIRIEGTRVSLDSIVYAFDRGASPEEIVESYPTVDLATVYATLAYVLQNRDEVDRYLEDRRASAERLRAEVEQRFPPDGMRARLLARRAATERQRR